MLAVGEGGAVCCVRVVGAVLIYVLDTGDLRKIDINHNYCRFFKLFAAEEPMSSSIFMRQEADFSWITHLAKYTFNRQRPITRAAMRLEEQPQGSLRPPHHRITTA